MNKVTRTIVVLTVIGLICGGVLSVVYQWTLPKIEQNQIRETNEAIFKVLPGTKFYRKTSKDDLTYFECFDRNSERIGTAIYCKGNGYQGEIKLLIGVNADFSRFTGMTILEQVETPGLGAKITEKWFENQFKWLVTTPPIEYVKGRSPEKPNEIQAIAGATISTQSVVKIINKAVEQWMQLK